MTSSLSCTFGSWQSISGTGEKFEDNYLIHNVSTTGSFLPVTLVVPLSELLGGLIARRSSN